MSSHQVELLPRLYTLRRGSTNGGASLEEGDGGRMAESQLSELRNMRVLLEEARALASDLAYHRRARLEVAIGRALDEVNRQIQELQVVRRTPSPQASVGKGKKKGRVSVSDPARRESNPAALGGGSPERFATSGGRRACYPKRTHPAKVQNKRRPGPRRAPVRTKPVAAALRPCARWPPGRPYGRGSARSPPR